MLNAKYFKSKFEGADAKAEPRMRTDIHLHSGAVFEIESVDAIEDGYVVLRAYPPRDSTAALRRDRGDAPTTTDADSATDRVVVAYESISCLHFSPVVVKKIGRTVGF